MDTKYLLAEALKICMKKAPLEKITVKDIDGLTKNVELTITQIKEPTSIIKYNSHIQGYGWENRWSKRDGNTTGTVDKSLRMEAIKISENYDIVELKAQEKWIGKTLRDLKFRNHFGMNVLLVKKENTKLTISPSGDYEIEKGDRLVAIDDKNIGKE